MSLSWAWFFALLGAGPASAERTPGDDEGCPVWGCGSNGTSETGLTRPTSVGSVELAGPSVPGDRCPWGCGNGTSETGVVLASALRVVSVELPAPVVAGLCAPWQCANGTSTTGLVAGVPALRVTSVELPAGCPMWGCSNGTSETGTLRPATAASSVTLPVSHR